MQFELQTPPTIPSCASSREMRKIGYYAGWGNRRACTKVAPHEVDWTGFTGAIFAFATISEGMEIQQKEHHNLKEVTVAVGGWNFSEDARTSHLFSDMISKTDSRKTFISSVKKFLTDYKLDGIDIDFEYPAAIERNASATDTPNFTAFIKELREALPTQVISCATPAGYWFLKGFEIDKIAEHVTYLNMMSYDYHGPWDLTVKDPAQKPVTNPQTSIRDIQNSVELYMRAGVKNLAKVNLGLAYYGRDYKLLDSKCVGYNCNMTGGGYKGPCTSESGILAQFEIEEELAKLKVKSPPTFPTLDVDSLTWWFDNDGSLVTYDQPDTWAIKSSFAANRCFGGTFIWSVDLVKPKTSRRVGTSCSGVGHDAFTSEKWSGQEPLGVGL
ncbi:Glycoside hydrolase family 18 protein [Mycena venus]|uniref:Glycoside hydrolase family 18 protein n=1 Tax=Mycena venus TaxID=2733690 RepID=A0A8H7CQR2_9AGAR|nr:Glycoside hydrolase family 18 protein [Mycena venus]